MVLASAVYVDDYAGPVEPWGAGTNVVAMDAVFGAGNWSDEAYGTVDPTALFSPNTCFIWLEGGADNDQGMQAFTQTYKTEMENWVANGGSLFFNSAGWNTAVGPVFGGVTLDLTYYDSHSSTGDIAAGQGGHSIFNGPYAPVGLSWSGTFFSHDNVIGAGGTALIDGTGGDILTELLWGNGTVMFGGMTATIFHAPNPDVDNLRNNILSYLSGICGGCDDADEDGVCDEDDNCPADANPGQEDTDSDGDGDACDDDDDGDGISDDDEIACGSNPLNAASTCEVCDGEDNDLDELVDEGFTDTDGDYMADCVDPDDDNDGILDDCDSEPLINNYVYTGFNNLPASWICGNNNNKVLICHGSNNPQTNCVSPSAVQSHLNHGDYLGPCTCTGQQAVAPPNNGGVSTGQYETLELELFPNPTSGNVNIHLHGLEGEAMLNIYDQLGRKVWTQQLEDETHAIQLDLDLQNGIYLVQVKSGEATLTERLVISRK